MQKNNFGRIIIISSEFWRSGMSFGLTNYAAAKSAALGFMRHLAHEVSRTGTLQDVGAAVAYLASREASWISGQVIPLNGGSITA